MLMAANVTPTVRSGAHCSSGLREYKTISEAELMSVRQPRRDPAGNMPGENANNIADVEPATNCLNASIIAAHLMARYLPEVHEALAESDEQHRR